MCLSAILGQWLGHAYDSSKYSKGLTVINYCSQFCLRKTNSAHNNLSNVSRNRLKKWDLTNINEVINVFCLLRLSKQPNCSESERKMTKESK